MVLDESKTILDNLDNLTDLSTEKMVLDASNPKRPLDKMYTID